MSSFPILRLSLLAVKYLGNPLNFYIRKTAKKNYYFRHYICVPTATFYNKLNVVIKMQMLHLGKVVNVPVLDEKMAIDLGATVLSEGIMFTIAASVIIFEFTRQMKKEAMKEIHRDKEISQLLELLDELYFRMERQEVKMKTLMRERNDSSLKGNFGMNKLKISDVNSHISKNSVPSVKHLVIFIDKNNNIIEI